MSLLAHGGVGGAIVEVALAATPSTESTKSSEDAP